MYIISSERLPSMIALFMFLRCVFHIVMYIYSQGNSVYSIYCSSNCKLLDDNSFSILNNSDIIMRCRSKLFGCTGLTIKTSRISVAVHFVLQITH